MHNTTDQTPFVYPIRGSPLTKLVNLALKENDVSRRGRIANGALPEDYVGLSNALLHAGKLGELVLTYDVRRRRNGGTE